jgi:hypothetical protein
MQQCLSDEHAILSLSLSLTSICDADDCTEDMLTRVQEWLASINPQSKLQASLKLRTAGTGKWYLQSGQYEAWKAGKNPFTWLYGSAGSGKTILSAGIIENMQIICKEDPAKSLAFFFFDFNDAKKQDPINMVKSLLSQFLNICNSVPDTVRTLHATCENGRREASQQQLLYALRDTLRFLPAPLIVLDALDECSNWGTLFEIIEEMQKWDKKILRMILTSRKEAMIEEDLEDIVPPDDQICLESHLVDIDIETYVQKRLAHKSFKRWHRDLGIQKEIQRTLGQKAHGMYSLSSMHATR